MTSPNDEIRARIFKIIADEDSLIADVWRLHESGIPPEKVDWDAPEWMTAESQSPTYLNLGETDQDAISHFYAFVATELHISTRKAEDIYNFFRIINGSGSSLSHNEADQCIGLVRDFKKRLELSSKDDLIAILSHLEAELLRQCKQPHEWVGPFGFEYRHLIACDVSELASRIKSTELYAEAVSQQEHSKISQLVRARAEELVAQQEDTTPDEIRRLVRLTEIGYGRGGSSVYASPAGWRG